jgi:MFS family permease
MFKALYFKNFRYFYFGFLLSNTGNMMQTVAISWLVYRLTDSTLMVGLLFFTKQLMMFFLSPIAGSLADSYKRVHIMLFTSLLSGIIGIALGVITIQGLVTTNYLLLYYFLDGILMGVDMTTRQALLKDMVRGKTFLTNAIALNSLLFNIARIIGPLLAAYIITIYKKDGEGVCFLINGASFFVVSIALLLMKNLRNEIYPSTISFAKKIQEGFNYTRKHPQIKDIIVLSALLGLFGFPITVLLPDFCKSVLLGDAQELGILTTLMGVGAVLGGIILATRKNFDTYQRLIVSAPYIYGGAILLLAFVSNYYIAILSMFFIGLGQALFYASCNSVIQILSTKNMVGRTVSLYIMLFMAATTIGSILSGKIAYLIGAPNTFLVSGIGCILSLWYYNFKIKSQAKNKQIILT